MINTIKPSQKPLFTIFVPFTRAWVLDSFFDSFDQMKFLPAQTEVVFYVDTDDQAVYDYVVKWQVRELSRGWNGLKVIRSGRAQPTDVSIAGRRERIVHMKEDSKQYIQASQYVFGMEDDTSAPPETFMKLYNLFITRQGVGFAQGVQMGRWNLRVIGAWKTDHLGEPTTMETIKYEPNQLVEIDGGGFFCYLTRVKLYKEHTYHWHDECFGPDATYGIEVKKLGYKCLMDTGLVCAHHTEKGILIPNSINTITAKWRKDSAWRVPEIGKVAA